MAGHVAQSTHVAHNTELLSGVSWSNSNSELGTTLLHPGSWTQSLCRYVTVVISYMTQNIHYILITCEIILLILTKFASQIPVYEHCCEIKIEPISIKTMCGKYHYQLIYIVLYGFYKISIFYVVGNMLCLLMSLFLFS